MKIKIMFLGLVGLAGVIALGAAAQGTGASTNSARQAQCLQQADEKDFGIHHYQYHRFVMRCVAGLSTNV